MNGLLTRRGGLLPSSRPMQRIFRICLGSNQFFHGVTKKGVAASFSEDSMLFPTIPAKHDLFFPIFASFKRYSSAQFPVRRLLRRFPVDVGCSLNVDVTGNTNVDVIAGDNMELITVEAEWFDSQARAENTEKFLKIASTSNSVDVSERDVEGHFLRPSLLRLHIPERWCSVSIHTWEGDVSLASITEGDVDISTDGGNVRIGKVKGQKTRISSSGGSVEGKTMYSNLHVTTSGGSVKFQNILGNDVAINTAGGEAIIGSMYGEKLRVDCSKFEAKNIKVDDARVKSSGAIKIFGLEGNAVISSMAGPIEIQVSERAKEVKLSSDDGEVIVSHPLSLVPKVEVVAAKSVDLGEGEKGDVDSNGYGKEEEAKRFCSVVVDCPQSDVTFRQQSWIEMMSKLI